MKMSDAFPSKWLVASDLKGREITATIQDVQMESVGNPPQNMPVVYFQKAAKALTLNKTNGNMIALQHGDDTDMWRGKKITLFPTTTELGGKIVDCIRIKNAFVQPDAPLPTTPPTENGPVDQSGDDLSDEIPF